MTHLTSIYTTSMTMFTTTFTKRALLATALLGSLVFASGASAADNPKVKFATTEGDFVVELYPDLAPKTVENFLQYVKDKHYDGTIFHRVINDFMVQGGGFDAAYAQKKTRPPVVNEGRDAIAKGGPKNVVGTIAMARTNEPNSATSQFFINVNANTSLDATVIPPGDPVPKFEYGGRTYENVPRANLLNASQLVGYAVFGKVTSGMDVVNKMKLTPTGAGGPFPSDVPKTQILINSATLVK
jgi:peptidyl-prolyl cis-trans isomerase A (cyclophilin A)